MNLRTHIATAGLKRTIEGNYGLPVILIAPDGEEIDTNEDGDQLKGQVLYDREGMDPETGDLIIVGETRITLRITALSRVPAVDEKWGIQFPINPAFPDVLATWVLDTSKGKLGGLSAGWITLLPTELEQV